MLLLAEVDELLARERYERRAAVDGAVGYRKAAMGADAYRCEWPPRPILTQVLQERQDDGEKT